MFTTMFLLALFIVQVSRILSYDIELEAIHFDKDLIKPINTDVELKKRKEEFQLKLLAMEPILRSNKNHDNALEIIPSVPFKVANIEDQNDEFKPTEDPSFNVVLFKKHRSNLINQLRTSGSLRLKTLAYFITNNLNPVPDINRTLNNATSDYLKAVNAYNAFISNVPVKYNMDKELVILDMIETTSNILLKEAKNLLNAIQLENHTELKTDRAKFIDKIKETVVEEKSEQLKYVCKDLNICRFPGYCERLSEMLEELQQLTDNSFKQIIFSLNETLTLKRHFFKTIMGDDVYNKLSLKLSDSIDNIKFMREIFKITRSVIIHKYKVFKDDSRIIKDKTKAVRILLDLIDRAFEESDNDVNFIDIENTISSYKQWAVGYRDDVGIITKKFIDNAVEIINYSWDKDIKAEVKVLTDVLFTGGTENVGVYDYLFTKGSNMVRN